MRTIICHEGKEVNIKPINKSGKKTREIHNPSLEKAQKLLLLLGTR